MTAITPTDAYLNLVRDAMQGLASDVEIHYVALGTGTAAPASSDTQLGNEVFRKAIASYADGVAAGELLTNGYIATGDAVGTAITEVGFFAGATASAAANTGTLFGRVLYSHTHTNTESLQLQLDSTV